MAYSSSSLPLRLVRRVMYPFQRFFDLESSSGILLIICTVAALAWANSPWADSYEHMLHTYLTVGVGGKQLSMSLLHWINDGLMSIFFFLVGLEIKRELLTGELASPRRAALPIVAAVGGILVPAGIYLLFNGGTEYGRGWGVLIATDIAFALGVLVLLGDRAPMALKIFLTALAIVDDLGAVVVVALFYTSEINWASLGLAGGILAALIGLNLGGLRYVPLYILLGIVLWLAVLSSGIHASVAGVLLALTIPARTRDAIGPFIDNNQLMVNDLQSAREENDTEWISHSGQNVLQTIYGDAGKMVAPLYRIEAALHSWVGYLIMPVFALANAGVALSGDALGSFGEPVLLGILLGLVLGKPIGIFLATYLAARFGLASLPANVTWLHIAGAACLGGIGFTMSIFIANLAFVSPEVLQLAKLGILVASVAAGILGWLVLSRSRKQPEQ